MIKQDKIIELHVPQYKELSVQNIWPMVKEVEDLMLYFPDYEGKQLPCWTHLFAILSTLRYKDVNNMISNARKNRALENQDDEDEFVYINKKIYEEIEEVMSQKCKCSPYVLLF